ncbi:malto-oligosyltrehalose trehalohydrolase [Actinotalea ferrariae CF5-4]|uniref:Malto-oligosyltrehalose trehalohydrolase n=1 Tax=Actinotalea ferrariae CF5-4 TaxID=948458 RepID=A0A021VPQ1_9CELL|nr:malto-oligosyltrehalose trehalohydrolase [Actinotalea ferrariae]EYR63159.1 malto-oligosyltrehalose trehalohydrolase [Actinotalea ferrariae CF5-4]
MTTDTTTTPGHRSQQGRASRPAVWAPYAARVDLHLPGEHGSGSWEDAAVHPMAPTAGGWWEAPLDLPDGTDYGFAVDGGDARPDPRSPWQPHGVHGPSRTYDPAAYPWGDGGWAGRDVRGAVVYELHVGTFTDAGTLGAAVEHLDDLVALGVDVVELMPVAAFPGVHGWGYDGVALFAVHDPYGGPAALQRFVDAAHARGLAVCLDVVHNHLGPSGNYLSVFGPYFTDRHETPWGEAVNLDGPDAGEVRRLVLDSALRWLRDFHVDALRLDAVHELKDDSPVHLLAELATAVGALAEEVGRPLSLIAESDLNDAAMVTPVAEGGLGMTAQWADDVHHAVHATITGERHGYYVDFGPLEVLATVLTRVFRHDGGYSRFRGRDWGRPVPAGTDGRRFVVFSQDHDQVGNRALGDRPSERVDPGGLAISAALVLLSPFTPMLFMGEEWGARTRWQFFTDHAEPELAEAIRRGRTAEFGGHGWEEVYGGPVAVPDPQAASTVAASRLDRAERDRPEHARMLRWYSGLITLRRAEPDLASGDLAATSTRHDDGGAWFVLHRGSVAVVLVLGDEPVTLDLQADEVLAAWDGADLDGGRVTVPGRSVAVVRTGAGA